MKLKKTVLAMLVAAAPLAAQAANWVDFIASEPADSPKAKLFGFIQPVYTYYDADKLEGFRNQTTGALNPNVNGKYQIQNMVQPTFEETQQFQFLRAQLGVRGRLNDKINYLVLTDVGQNLTTVQHPFMLTDAVMTFSYIPGAKIRAGLFKLPTGEEALVPNPIAFSYVYYSLVTSAVVQETFFKDKPYTGAVPAGCANIPGSKGTFPNGYLDCSQVVSGNNAFRDWGIEVFDSFTKDKWELGYAVMVSNGNEIENISDDNSSKDVTARLQLSYIFGGKGPLREDADIFVWHQSGDRNWNKKKEYNRTREGAGFRVTKGPYRVSGEYIRADGMIPGGPNPPVTNPGSTSEGDLVPPYNIIAAPKGKADGWYVEGGWRFLPDWEVNVRYDSYDRFTDDAASERVFNTWTLGGQYFINKNSRVTLNYEWREAEVPNPSAITNVYARSNADIIANNLADRISLQLTYSF